MIFVFGLDDGFTMPTGVAAASLDRFLGTGDEIVFLHTGLRRSNIDLLQECVGSAHARFVDCSGQFHPAWTPPGWLTVAAFARFLAAERLPEVDRCVYLDGDVIVRRDPRDLAEASLDGRILGAVRSRVAPFLASPGGVRRWFELGLPSTAPYFNSGVLVMDLDRWRSADVTPRLSAFLREHGHDTWIADQEAMNAVLADDWVPLDRTWNYITHVSESFLQDPDAETRDPHVVHFAGRRKPWLPGPLPLFAEDWYAALAFTPWKGFRPQAPAAAGGVGPAVRRLVGRAITCVRAWADQG